MHAIRVSATGGPEVLGWTSTETPAPGPGEVLVRMEAAGVNFIDVYHRMGLYSLELPFTPGAEGAGVVEVAGSGVSTVRVGDRVAWAGPIGSYAEYAKLAADRCVVVPDSVELAVAAAVMLQGMTAHYLCGDTFPLAEGHRCLVHAGAGGVGHLLIQMAKMRGATVYTTVSSEAKAETARRAGADHIINYVEADFGDAIEELAGPKALDVVYDGIGADTLERGMELLRPRGMMVSFGNASGPPPSVDPIRLMSLGSLFITRPTLGDYVENRGELERRATDLFRWISGGELNVHIGARFPLAEAAEAHRMLEGRGTIGKVVLDV
ncbi:MAG TPA: quinone oxidoreductase [Acidimicrobiia bacterium]|nr:quinone oxidoreductase [Acidimicrobiia bacterium]